MSPEAIAGWNAKPTGRRGAQPKYSDLAIETALALRRLLHLPLRQTEGFLGSLFDLMSLHLDVPDHTTLSRRGRDLKVPLRVPESAGPIDLIVDSTGLSIFGQGEWAAAKHGGSGVQGWKKLHLGVDGDGVIVAQELTDSNVDDATTGIDLIDHVGGDIAAVIGDGAYDARPFYEAVADRGAEPVIPPIKTAQAGDPACPARDRTVVQVQVVGKRKWKKESGYHRQGRVENTFHRYKRIIGGKLRARGREAQEVEARIACNLLNRMFELGRPVSVAIKS